MIVRLLVKLGLSSGWLDAWFQRSHLGRKVFITNAAQGRDFGMRSRGLFSAFHPSGQNSNVFTEVEFI